MASATAADAAIAYKFDDGTEITRSEAIDEVIEAARLGGEHEAYMLEILNGVPGIISAGDDEGRTALHMAAANGHLQMAKVLLAPERNPPADVNVATKSGATPLHWAVVNGQVELVEFLLSAGARVDMLTASKDSALDLVLSVQDDEKREKIEKILISVTPADPEGDMVERDVTDKVMAEEDEDAEDDGEGGDGDAEMSPGDGAAAGR